VAEESVTPRDVGGDGEAVAVAVGPEGRTSGHGRGSSRYEERFLSAQADRFAGAKREEKASACFVRNDEVRDAAGERN
jgi:hypothetical protein